MSGLSTRHVLSVPASPITDGHCAPSHALFVYTFVSWLPLHVLQVASQPDCCTCTTYADSLVQSYIQICLRRMTGWPALRSVTQFMYEPSPIVAKLYSVCTVSQASSVLAESHALTTSEPVHVVKTG